MTTTPSTTADFTPLLHAINERSWHLQPPHNGFAQVALPYLQHPANDAVVIAALGRIQDDDYRINAAFTLAVLYHQRLLTNPDIQTWVRLTSLTWRRKKMP